ncbi:hypothetical protein HZU77_012915 [Neisseriaceae bacterium TC5R-5]|nr:hypothetical protein [Neisseriaceae bacterium TC5R-5]
MDKLARNLDDLGGNTSSVVPSRNKRYLKLGLGVTGASLGSVRVVNIRSLVCVLWGGEFLRCVGWARVTLQLHLAHAVVPPDACTNVYVNRVTREPMTAFNALLNAGRSCTKAPR